jgi:tripartite-type tricarboxylate transporter receptor subunit TctC
MNASNSFARRRFLRLTTLASTLLTTPLWGLASETYPGRPVKLVVPFPAGGPADLVARIVAEEFQKEFRQPFIVENRPGASGTLGASTVAKSPADGLTLLVTSASTQSVVPATMKTKPYDPVRDFTPVSQLATIPFALIVGPSIPARDLAQFIQLAKNKPGDLAHGVSGVGSLVHLAGVRFEVMTTTKLTAVQYRGAQPVLVDLAGGQLQFAFMDVGNSAQFVKSGRVRALAVASAKRVPALQDVPTFAEAGLPGFEIPSWIGLFAPAGTPPDVVAALTKASAKALSEKSVQDRLDALGARPAYGEPLALAKTVAADFQQAQELARTARIEID